MVGIVGVMAGVCLSTRNKVRGIKFCSLGVIFPAEIYNLTKLNPFDKIKQKEDFPFTVFETRYIMNVFDILFLHYTRAVCTNIYTYLKCMMGVCEVLYVYRSFPTI